MEHTVRICMHISPGLVKQKSKLCRDAIPKLMDSVDEYDPDLICYNASIDSPTRAKMHISSRSSVTIYSQVHVPSKSMCIETRELRRDAFLELMASDVPHNPNGLHDSFTVSSLHSSTWAPCN